MQGELFGFVAMGAAVAVLILFIDWILANLGDALDARKLATGKSVAGGDGSQKRQRASTRDHKGTPNQRPLSSAL